MEIKHKCPLLTVYEKKMFNLTVVINICFNHKIILTSRSTWYFYVPSSAGALFYIIFRTHLNKAETDSETYFYIYWTLAKQFTCTRCSTLTRNAARFARNAKRSTRNAERFKQTIIAQNDLLAFPTLLLWYISVSFESSRIFSLWIC